MKTNKKLILALGLTTAFLLPNTAKASDVNSLISEIYDGMDSINQATGKGPVARPDLPQGSSTTTTTTTTVIKSTDGKVLNAEKDKKSKAEKVIKLKEELAKQEIAIKSAEEILAKYPKTIRGKEEKLVDVLTRAFELRLKAAAAIKNLTGETIKVKSLNIPQEYRHLIKTI